MKAAGQLRFRFGQIKGNAVGFGEPTDEDQPKGDRLNEAEPDSRLALRLNNPD